MSAQQDVDRRGGGPTIDDLRERLLAGLPVTDRRLTVAGVSTAVLEGGHGPPVVFLQAEFAARVDAGDPGAGEDPSGDRT